MSKSLFDSPIGQHGKRIKMEHLKNSWSKWGGGGLGVDKRVAEWTCQVCAELQPKEIDPFLLPINDREFLRICPKCQNAKVRFHVVTYEALILIKKERKDSDFYHEI